MLEIDPRRSGIAPKSVYENDRNFWLGGEQSHAAFRTVALRPDY
jgi:hypothetical protein